MRWHLYLYRRYGGAGWQLRLSRSAPSRRYDAAVSELTRCNYCNLEEVKRQHPDADVHVRTDDGWLQVYVDAEPIGMWFLALTTHCVC